MTKIARVLEPVTPGELLWEEFMSPMGLSRYRLAKEIDVPAQRIGDIVNGKRAITADTDLRLCRFFGLSDGYWLRAQTAYEIEVAQRELAPVLKKIKPWAGTAA
jgi:addiction module HigA family antidote